MQQLRDYQAATINEYLPEAFKAGAKKICLVGPCGCGKTTIIAGICERSVERGRTVTVVAHRRRLIQQIAERLSGQNIPYTVQMADLPDEPWVKIDPTAPIVVGSMQTMSSQIGTVGVRQTDLVIPDESHTITSVAYQQLIQKINAKWLIGPTATPCLSNGAGFGPKIFDCLIEVTRIENLLAEGYLHPVEVWSPVGIGKRRRKGLPASISGDPVEHWKAHAAGLRTLTFCNKLDECRAVCDAFNAEGIPAEHIDGYTIGEERDEVLAKLETGEIKVVVCTPSLMGVGVDLPFLECVQCLVKNDSVVAFWQSIGRGQRTHWTKKRAVLLDHSGAVFVHGMPNISPEWSLGAYDSVHMRVSKKQNENPAECMPQVCKGCGAVSAGSSRCPKCQEMLFVPKVKEVVQEREQLSFVDDVDSTDTQARTADPRHLAEWQKMLYVCAAKGWTASRAMGMFKGKYGVWPDRAGVSPCPQNNERQKLVAELFPDFVREKRKVRFT